MGKWSDDLQTVEEPLIRFNSWRELNEWDDSVNARESCWFLEREYVLNCYALYRNMRLNDKIGDIYTDGYAGMDFTILAEVPPNDKGYDLCSLPLYLCEVEGEEVALYPEEIFPIW